MMRLLLAGAVASAALVLPAPAYAEGFCASGQHGELCVVEDGCLVSGWVNGIPAIICVGRV